MREGRERSSHCPSSLGTGWSFDQTPVEVRRSTVRFWTCVSEEVPTKDANGLIG